MTSPADDRADPRDVAHQIRAVLDEIADPDDELTASAATKHRLEGAALALEAIASAQDIEADSSTA